MQRNQLIVLSLAVALLAFIGMRIAFSENRGESDKAPSGKYYGVEGDGPIRK